MDINIEQVLIDLGIDYTTKYNGFRIPCPSPDHIDRHPSCDVSSKAGGWNCHACKAKGSLKDLIYLTSGQSFGQFFGLKRRGYGGMSLPTWARRAPKKDVPKRSVCAGITIEGVLQSPKTNPIVERFLEAKGFTQEFQEAYNVSWAYYIEARASYLPADKNLGFSNRVFFPVYDDQGVMINLEARDYTGSSERKVLYPRGGRSDTLFNYQNISPFQPLVLTEGIKGLANIWSGYKNVVSSFGAKVKQGHIDQIMGWYEKNPHIDLIIFHDNDKSGLEMAAEYDELLPFDFRVCCVDQYKGDPADVPLEERMQRIEQALPYNEVMVNKLFEARRI